MNYKLILFLFFGISCCSTMEAQILYVDGYVVLTDRDTLYGKILYGTPALRSAKAVFKQDDDSEKIRFRPFNIRGYFCEGQHFVSMIYDIHPSLSYGLGVFMEQRSWGTPIQVFEYWNTDNERGFTQTFLKRKDLPSFEINFLRFKSGLSTYFSDYPQLSEDILRGTYKKKQLLEIVQRYNNWVNNGKKE